MGEHYKNPLGGLNEARKHYKNLLNEEGFPGMCCDGGPACVPVTFASANDDCNDLQMEECTHPDCQGHPGGDDGLTPADIEVDTGTTNVDQQVSCLTCQNGSPVGWMFNNPPGCPQGWIIDDGTDPCLQSTDPCAFPDISGPCATQADLINQFVNPPTQFLANMLSWYTNPPNPQNFPGNRGCNFLGVVRQKHIDHLNTGYAINNNHPAPGVHMGPLWIAQKTAKVVYLDCVLAALAADGCCDGVIPPDGPPEDEIMMAKKGNPDKGSDTKGAARKGMRK